MELYERTSLDLIYQGIDRVFSGYDPTQLYEGTGQRDSTKTKYNYALATTAIGALLLPVSIFSLLPLFIGASGSLYYYLASRKGHPPRGQATKRLQSQHIKN
jgi:hypothetical protein